MKSAFATKKVIVFDLDGTITKSKLPIDREMMRLLLKLLEEHKVAVVGGGKFDLFKVQFLQKLPRDRETLKNLFLFPTNGTAMYKYRGGSWINVYKHEIVISRRRAIKAAIQKALARAQYVRPRRIYGAMIEDRGTQITFSATGQNAPLSVKTKWNKTSDIRLKVIPILKQLLRNKYEIRAGGLTSIDITPKGIDKAYAIYKIQRALNAQKKEMLFIGDALYPGGNDYAAIRTGIRCIKVAGPEETKRVIKKLI